MHLLPQLRKLEQKYCLEMVIIGVHTPKFTSEMNTENIRSAVIRYRLNHPVINDSAYGIWRDYDIHAWPTLIFIDPVGQIMLNIEGEVTFDSMDSLLGKMVRHFDEAELLKRSTLASNPHEKHNNKNPKLSFPGNITADKLKRRLFISDSNNDRIIMATPDGRVTDIIGSGTPGNRDGNFSTAQFSSPQGMSVLKSNLYVCDTDNHAIRRVDLTTNEVDTIIDTANYTLSSPWDVACSNNYLYFAMAGIHQLWDTNLTTGETLPLVGTGYEGLKDGPTTQAWLAQPSGIAIQDNVIYFADSETSSIRQIDLMGDQSVETLVGIGLFEFGDTDGIGNQVRLQHPLGLTLNNGYIFLADTYNNKIKKLNPYSRKIVTLAGTGESGFTDGKSTNATFNEPSGLTILDNTIYIADTNNNAIRTIDISTLEVRTLEVTGL